MKKILGLSFIMFASLQTAHAAVCTIRVDNLGRFVTIFHYGAGKKAEHKADEERPPKDTAIEAVNLVRGLQRDAKCDKGDIKIENDPEKSVFDGYPSTSVTQKGKVLDVAKETDCGKDIPATLSQTWTFEDTGGKEFDLPADKTVLTLVYGSVQKKTFAKFASIGDRVSLGSYDSIKIAQGSGYKFSPACEFRLKPPAAGQDWRRLHGNTSPYVVEGKNPVRSLKIISATLAPSAKGKSEENEIVFQVDAADTTFDTIRCKGVKTFDDLKKIISGSNSWRLSGVECPTKVVNDAMLPDPKHPGRRGLKQLPSDGKDTWSSEPKPAKAGQI